jgi:6-phosphogluconolactonase
MKTISWISLLVFSSVVAICLLLATEDSSVPGGLLVYVGTARYTGQTSKSIFAFRLNPATAQLRALGVAAEADNPGFLAVHPNQRFLYAVNETGNQEAKDGGSVTAFSMDSATGKLKLLNKVPTHGAHPCYVAVDKTGRYVVVANYYGGTVESFPVRNGGQLGEASSVVKHSGSSVNKERQEAPHPHGLRLSPDNRFVVAADLGIDKLMIHHFSSTDGSLTPNNPPSVELSPGAGPRHVAFSRNGKFVYVVNELNSSVSAFPWDVTRATVRPIQTISTRPREFKGENSGAEIEVSPSGFLYVSNRGHDSIAIFSVDEAKGTLAPIAHVPTQGKTPRNFGIDPSGSYLIVANQDSQNLVVFRIDGKTGRLAPAGQALKVTSLPVCVAFAR